MRSLRLPWKLRVRFFFLTPLLLSAMLSATTTARAETNEEARVLFDAGVGASLAERWLEAVDYFKRSLALAEKAATALNLAVAEVKLGLGHDALRSLETFERIADPTHHADLLERAHALKALAEEAARLEAEPVASNASSAAAEPEREPPPEPLAVTPITSSPSLAETAAPLPPRSEQQPPWMSLGLLTGALVSGGIVTGSAMWWANRERALEHCGSRNPPCDNRSVIEGERTAAITTTLVAATSAAVLATLGSWHLVSTRKGVPPTLSLAAAPRALQVTMTW